MSDNFEKYHQRFIQAGRNINKQFLPHKMSRKMSSPVNGEMVSMRPGGKPPKRYHNPGEFYLRDGKPMMVAYCYRLKDDPGKWLYCLEELDAVTHLGDAKDGKWVCYELFYDSADARKYFSTYMIGRWQHNSVVVSAATMKTLPKLAADDERVVEALKKGVGFSLVVAKE